MAKKIELLHTTYDESGNIESQEVVHPLTSPDCIIMENGKTLDEVMGDGIATPTLTHEGTSFKVGVGDSNIEVVDGDVAGMTLKGQSYQNILPKPTTLIMETDEKEFKINDKIDSNIIIDDNIAEIATVKGKTIVNTVQEESGSEYTVLGEDLSGQGIITTNKSEGNIKGVTLQGQTLVNVIQEPCEDEYVVLGADDGNLAYETIIKPSTLYTVKFKHDTVNADNPLTVDLGGTTQTVTSTEFTITTPSTLTHNQLVFSGKNNVVSEVQVIESDVTNIEYPFFEGMNDVKFSDSQFIARGKNLLHVGKGYSTTEINGLTVIRNEVEQTITINGTCTLDNTSCGLAPFYREFKKGERYAFSCKLISGTADKILFRVNDEQWEGNISCGLKATSSNIYETCIKTFYSDETYNRSSIRVNNGATFNNAVFKVMLEKIPTSGDYTPQYEPYKGIEVQQDVDSIPLTSDMFEQGNIASGKIVGMSYQQLSHNTETVRVKSKTLIPIKPNGKYIMQNLNKTNNRLWGWQYDKNGGYLSSIGNTDEIDVFQFDSKAHYITFVLCNQNDSAISPSDLDSMNLILQEVPQEIVLRGIGDVKDELDLTRGEYIQRIKEFVLNGSEYWIECTDQHGENTMLFQYRGIGCSTISNYTTDGFMCSQLKSVVAAQQWTNNEQCISLNITNAIGIRVSKTNATNKNEFLSWLQKEPITIQCRLNVPIIHKVNLTNTKVIQSYSTETHYETITPSDSLIPNITIPSTLNYDVAIKPSTEYTIRANTSDNLTVDLGGTIGTLSNGKVTLTTPATLTHNEVKFSGTGKVKELMVVEGNEIKDNVPFFNGMKNVQMGGIKLVNIARYKSHANGVSVNTNKTTITFDDDGGVGTASWGVCQFYDELLKPNTMYTIFMNVTKNTSTNETPVKIQLGNASERFTNINRGFTGKFKEKIVTSNDISERTLALFFRRGQANEQVVIQNPMIIEGDWTHLDEIPFIESEMIIDQPIIRSQGKNLFDISRGINYTWHSKYTINGDGSVSVMPTIVDGVAYVQSEFFFLEVGKTYTVSWNASGNIHASFVWLAGTTNSPYGTSNTFTVVEGKNKLTLAMYVDTSSLENVATFKPQIQEGTTATSYEPYKHQTLYSNRVIGYEEGVHYGYGDGVKYTNANYNSVMADVEGLSIAYVTNGSSNFTFWDKDGVYVSGKGQLDTALSLTDKNGFITVPTNAKYMKFASSCSTGANTDYTKATVTGELPLRSLPNGVCDTLNLVTGEYVQRVGEVVLDGSQKHESWLYNETNQTLRIYIEDAIQMQNSLSDPLRYEILVSSDKLTSKTYVEDWNSGTFISLALGKRIVLRIEGITTISQLTTYLKQNPITVQYQLATPIVRKLGFTTKGNYRQANLVTDCEWGASPTTANNTFTTRYRTKSASSLPIVYNTHLFSNDFPIRYFNVDAHMDYEYISNMEYGQYVNVRRDKLEADTVEAFNKWLQHNPIEVGYITWEQSSESYSNIHKPIFFNNVNVQYLPNNVDIQPELTYQVRTRNSYVMNMMKPNTTYTMKCLAYSNSAKLYVANSSANTSVSSNKTLQFAQSHLDGSKNELVLVGQWYEPMVIEGDVTGKNLPYFKGILSSYHDVDEIEVYSVNKNLFDMSKVKPFEGRGTYWWNTIIKENEVVSVRIGNIEAGQFGAYIKLNVRPNSVYTLYIEMEKDGEPFNGQIYGYENGDLWGNGTFSGYANTTHHLRTSQNAKYITIGFNYGKDFPIGTTLVSKNMRLYLGEENPAYIPHTHNTTIIEMPTRLETVKVVRPIMENGGMNVGNGVEVDSATTIRSNFIPVQPNEFIQIKNGNTTRLAHVMCYDINKNFIEYLTGDATYNGYVPNNCYFIRINLGKSSCSDMTITRQAWKPIQLNSLPNGVYDEIIMKPNSNKAQLVQRVGKVVLDGIYYPLSASASEVKGDDISCTYSILNNVAGGICQSDKLLNVSYSQDYKNIECIMLGTNTIIASILKTRAYNAGEYTKENPITVYYELTTPIIHEIQLKGYPHVYENGTVTLNTDTPHQTLVSYNVNQEQLINTQNETIIRHDQQIDDLYYYIEMYLEEIYQMELFRMKLELSL